MLSFTFNEEGSGGFMKLQFSFRLLAKLSRFAGLIIRRCYYQLRIRANNYIQLYTIIRTKQLNLLFNGFMENWVTKILLVIHDFNRVFNTVQKWRKSTKQKPSLLN